MTSADRSSVWRVATLNIWNRQGPWEHRLRLLENGISETNPDVIGLQEVIHRPGDDSVHHLTHRRIDTLGA